MHIRACIRRRSKAKALSCKASLRPLSLCDSPLPEKIISEKRNPFFTQSFMDLGYDSLQPPEKAKTQPYTTYCSAPESVRWIPQIKPAFQNTKTTKSASPASLRGSPAQPELAASKSASRSRLVTPTRPISEHSIGTSDASSVASQSSTKTLIPAANPEDDPVATTTVPASPSSSLTPVVVRASESVAARKARRKPPPLAYRETNGHGRSQSTDNRIHAVATGREDEGNAQPPVITITEVTQTLLAAPQVDEWLRESPNRSDSTFPTSPSPSDLGLASPLSSSLGPDDKSPGTSRRRDSRLGVDLSVDVDAKLARLVEVVNLYLPTLNDEMAIRRGEMLRLTKEYKDGWCAVERLDSGEKGVVPRFCVAANSRDESNSEWRRFDSGPSSTNSSTRGF